MSAPRAFDPDHCTACGDFLPCGNSWLHEAEREISLRMHEVQFERANRVTAENDEHLSRLIDAEQQLGHCICAAGPNFEGPDETCGIHGRTYAYWVEGYETVQLRLEEAVHERDLLRREVARLRETTYVAAGDLDALRMDLDEACPHGTEGHGGHAEGACEVCDYAFATNAIVDEWYEKVRSGAQEAGA